MIVDVISNFVPAMMSADETRLWRALISRIHLLIICGKNILFTIDSTIFVNHPKAQFITDNSVVGQIKADDKSIAAKGVNSVPFILSIFLRAR